MQTLMRDMDSDQDNAIVYRDFVAAVLNRSLLEKQGLLDLVFEVWTHVGVVWGAGDLVFEAWMDRWRGVGSRRPRVRGVDGPLAWCGEQETSCLRLGWTVGVGWGAGDLVFEVWMDRWRGVGSRRPRV